MKQRNNMRMIQRACATDTAHKIHKVTDADWNILEIVKWHVAHKLQFISDMLDIGREIWNGVWDHRQLYWQDLYNKVKALK